MIVFNIADTATWPFAVSKSLAPAALIDDVMMLMCRVASAAKRRRVSSAVSGVLRVPTADAEPAPIADAIPRNDILVADLRFELPSTYDQIKVLRARLRKWCEDHHRSPDDHFFAQAVTSDLQLVASELFTNAVRATIDGSPVGVSVTWDDRHIELQISNHGSGFDPDTIPLAPPDDSGGRGIAIARAVGKLQVHQRGRITSVSVSMNAAR